MSKFHTPCKQCYFAEYTEKTQTGCSMGLIEEYKKTEHIKVIEAYDEEKEFFVIDGKQCAGYKEPKYFESRNIENLTREEKVAYVKDKLKLKYIAIINCYEIDLETLANIVEELKQAEVQPDCIMICINENSRFGPHEYYKVLNKSKIKSRWKIRNVTHKDQTHIVTVHEVINLGAENCNFVLSVDGDFTNLSKIINEANDITYKRFGRFVVLSNKNKETILFNKFVYKSGLACSHDIITNYEEYTII